LGPLASLSNKQRDGLSAAEVLKETFNKTHRGNNHGVDHDNCQRFFCRLRDWKGLGSVCKTYCAPNATFAAQAEPLAGIKTLAEYAEVIQ